MLLVSVKSVSAWEEGGGRGVCAASEGRERRSTLREMGWGSLGLEVFVVERVRVWDIIPFFSLDVLEILAGFKAVWL